jgi:hypothetical protein
LAFKKFLACSKIKIIIFVAKKIGMTKENFPPLLLMPLLDPVSKIRDPG